ncbi:LysR family transcriptional regulator [Brucella anthropi]|uniref:LysR family transcriptional regulator n=1 Tax=Brucella anthropi TaxID=529 RepID=UPI001CFCA1AA|nr:LysR family transcriptional regulator [Brucella anthropi]
MKYTFKQLNSFVTVVQLGTLTGAAEYLHVSQPALTSQLRDLQNSVEFKLFEKEGRRLKLTAEGEQFYVEAERLLHATTDMNHQIELIKRNSKGRLHIGCDPAWGGEMLAPALQAFMKEYPDTSVIVHPTSSSEMRTYLHASGYDVVLMSVPIENPYFTHYNLGQSKPVVVLPHDHKFSQRPSILAEDLINETFIILASRENITSYKTQIVFQKLGLARKIALYAQSAGLVFSLVEQSVGIAIMSNMIAQSLQNRFNVSVVSFGHDTNYDVHCYTRREERPNTLSAAFLRILKSQLIK